MSLRRLAQSTILLAALGLPLATAGAASAPAPALIVLVIKNHRFTPAAIDAPAGQRFAIQVRNLDDTPEEFESYDMKVEKIVVPHGTITIQVRPLKPGLYKFFGDYHPDQAKGVLRVVAAPGVR